jgi:hypothetical protein
MTNKISYGDDEAMGEVRVIPDFLPPPDELVFWEDLLVDDATIGSDSRIISLGMQSWSDG